MWPIGLALKAPLREDLSLALGTSEVTLLELTDAYATLASGGVRATPYSIQAVVGEDGRILESPPRNARTGLSARTRVSGDANAGRCIAKRDRKILARAGANDSGGGQDRTSENFQDAWFVGYTTELACGVWVGYDRHNP